jgi:general secretion pathway protein I
MKTKSIKHGRAENKGFALLEALIALAIIGGLLVTVIYTVNHHLGIADRNETRTVAATLAWDKLIDVKAGMEAKEGDFADQYADYHYKAEIKDSPFPGISEVSVSVKRGKEEVVLKEYLRK